MADGSSGCTEGRGVQWSPTVPRSRRPAQGRIPVENGISTALQARNRRSEGRRTRANYRGARSSEAEECRPRRDSGGGRDGGQHAPGRVSGGHGGRPTALSRCWCWLFLRAAADAALRVRRANDGGGWRDGDCLRQRGDLGRQQDWLECAPPSSAASCRFGLHAAAKQPPRARHTSPA